MASKETHFVMKNGRAEQPKVIQENLELYYDVKGKTNNDAHKDTLLDMSGNKKHGTLTDFAYRNQSGYADGLIFDGVDDTLTRPSITGLDPNNMTYQMNGNILRFDGDEVEWIDSEGAAKSRAINLLRNSNFHNGLHAWTGANIKHIDNGILSHSDVRYNGIQQIMTSSIYSTIKPSDIKGHVLFFSAEIYVPDRGVVLYLNDGMGQTNSSYTDYFNKFTLVSGIRRISEDATTLNFKLQDNRESPDKSKYGLKYAQVIDLTQMYGAGNEPTIEEIRDTPDDWPWIPNPNDLIEASNLKGNILGDLEGVIDSGDRDRVSGEQPLFTDKADDDSVVHVEIDGNSVGGGSGKNLASAVGLVDDLYSNGISTSLAWVDDVDSNSFTYRTIPNMHTKTTYLDSKFKTNTAYTISFTGQITNESNPAVSSVIGFRYTDETNGNVVTIRTSKSEFKTTSNPDKTVKSIQFGWGHAGNAVIQNFQLEEGLVATEYEPPAPTPDYPIEINSVNNVDVVSSVGGRNLLLNSADATSLNFNSNNQNIIPLRRGIDNGINWFTQNDLDGKFGISTYISNIFRAGYGSVYSETLRDYLGDLAYSVDVMSPEPVHLRFIPANSATPIPVVLKPNTWTRLQYSGSSISDVRPASFFSVNSQNIPIDTKIYWKNYKIEKGSDSTPYSQAPEDIQSDELGIGIYKTNLLLDEPLRSVGDVKDGLFRGSDGLWKIERNVGEQVFNGTENWNYQPADQAYWRTIPDKTIGRRGMLSSHFNYTYSPNYQIGSFQETNSNRNALFYFDGGVGGSDGFKNWLANNPMTITYELESPTTETLPTELQDKLNNIASFSSSNYVYTVTGNDVYSELCAAFKSKDYLKEDRTVNNLLIYNRALSDDEMLHNYQLFHERFNMRSDTYEGNPTVTQLNLTSGGTYVHSIEKSITLNI